MVDLLRKPGRAILLGNEAIVRGALEAGVGFASTYPGTPASEVGDTFAQIAGRAGIYFEYSTNEKVALEAAAGVAFSGVRSIVSMKHFGLNVASDSLLPVAYIGVAGMVVMVADDPSCWSSAQSEQDTRYYAMMGHIPMLEPSNPQECKDFVKYAFDLSTKFKLPVLVRTTTRVSHERGIVKLGRIVKGKTRGKFVKDLRKFNNLPPHTMEMHARILDKIERIRKISEKSDMNFLAHGNVQSDFGIIVSGVSFNYVMDAMEDLDKKYPILKLGFTYPLPETKIKNFIKRFRTVLIIEELEPLIEERVNALAKDVNPKLTVLGKKLLPRTGEYDEEIVVSAINKITGRKLDMNLIAHAERYKKLDITKRSPILCPGCPHRATFYAAKVAGGKDTIYGGDVGCYVLGLLKPLETQDFIFSMGAVEGIVHGIKKVSDQKAIAFIGDSTFFHAGMPGLVNIVYNNSNPLIIALDNRITAMTGHQPHPGVGVTGMGEKTKEIAIEDIAKACKIEHVKTVDPFNLNEMITSIRDFLAKNEASMIVARRECHLLAVKKKKAAGVTIPKFEIDPKKCNRCGVCLYDFACPAIMKKGKSFYIDKNICTGCAVCVQVCPVKAISAVKE